MKAWETTPQDSIPEAASLGPAALEGSGDLREVKVRLPVKQVLRLHYARMTKRKNFSQIVSTALTRYFDELAET